MNSKTICSAPAFPCDRILVEVGDEQTVVSHAGMALRDYFAAKAMQAYMTGDETQWGEDAFYAAARSSYRLADIMMEVREHDHR